MTSVNKINQYKLGVEAGKKIEKKRIKAYLTSEHEKYRKMNRTGWSGLIRRIIEGI